MKPLLTGPLSLRTRIEQWPFTAPFRITGRTWAVLDVLIVELEVNGQVGKGEAAGVYYKNDSPATLIKQVESLRTSIEKGISRDLLQAMLPVGGARNAIDCALWDLEAKLTGRPVWQLAGMDAPRALLTNFGCGADAPERMAATARGYAHARAIKLKLTGEPIDAERVLAVRDARPDVRLSVDANQGFTKSFLEHIMPVFVQAKVELIEQPFAAGQDALLDEIDSPIPIAADESVQSAADLASLAGRFEVVNIKLDKCGGLTAGLEMARIARNLGLDTMVGNMFGTSLAMAPAYLLGQRCAVVDLDGPLFLSSDRAIAVEYADGLLTCPEALWGGADQGTPSQQGRQDSTW